MQLTDYSTTNDSSNVPINGFVNAERTNFAYYNASFSTRGITYSSAPIEYQNEGTVEINYATSYVDASKYTRDYFEVGQDSLATYRIACLGTNTTTSLTGLTTRQIAFQVYPLLIKSTSLLNLGTDGKASINTVTTEFSNFDTVNTSVVYYTVHKLNEIVPAPIKLPTDRYGVYDKALPLYTPITRYEIANINEISPRVYTVGTGIITVSAFVETYVLTIYNANKEALAEQYVYIPPSRTMYNVFGTYKADTTDDNGNQIAEYDFAEHEKVVNNYFALIGAPFGALTSNVYTIPLYTDGTPRLNTRMAYTTVAQVESSSFDWENGNNAAALWGRLNSYYINSFVTEGKSSNIWRYYPDRTWPGYVANLDSSGKGSTGLNNNFLNWTSYTTGYSARWGTAIVKPKHLETGNMFFTNQSNSKAYVPYIRIKNLNGTDKKNANGTSIVITDLVGIYNIIKEVKTDRFNGLVSSKNSSTSSGVYGPIDPITMSADAGVTKNLLTFTPEIIEYLFLKYGECIVELPPVNTTILGKDLLASTWHKFPDGTTYVPRLYIKTRQTKVVNENYKLAQVIVPYYLDPSFNYIDCSNLVFERLAYKGSDTPTIKFNSITFNSYRYNTATGITSYGYLKVYDYDTSTLIAEAVGSKSIKFTPPNTKITGGYKIVMFATSTSTEVLESVYIPIRFGDAEPTIHTQFTKREFTIDKMTVRFSDQTVIYPINPVTIPLPNIFPVSKIEVWGPNLKRMQDLKELYIDKTGMYITDITNAAAIRSNPEIYRDQTYFNSNYNFVRGFKGKVSANLTLPKYTAEIVDINTSNNGGKK